MVQLEAILAHELAHIRRHDSFVNLLQTAVETLLFYHPAVWWLSRRIRQRVRARPRAPGGASAPHADRDTILAVLRASARTSSFERSQVLLGVARTHVLAGDLRDAYIEAADGLGSFEEGQVMTALVRGERRE